MGPLEALGSVTLGVVVIVAALLDVAALRRRLTLIITDGPRQSRALARRLLALAGRERTDPIPKPDDAPNNHPVDHPDAHSDGYSDGHSDEQLPLSTDSTSRHTGDDINVTSLGSTDD